MAEPANLEWDFCRSFLAVMREGSLSAAARALGLTQPTLGRHVAGLEAVLNTKLFTRSQHGLMPTSAARDLLPHAEAMAGACEALARAASGEAEATKGVVRLTASEFIGVEVLPAILARFRALHPEIQIELAVTNRQQDLLRREADIAVRMVRPRQTPLVARRIGRVPIGLFAHRRYISDYGLPSDASELPRHAIIGFDRDDSGYRGLGAGLRVTRELFSFRSDSDLAQLAALRAGLGIAGCQVPIARRDADLIAVLPDEFAFGLDMWLAMHEDLRGSRRVRLLYDHLATELLAYVASGGDRNPGSPSPATPPKLKTAGIRRPKGRSGG
jgi:DNA-binding transcriptional LysR family regulator